MPFLRQEHRDAVIDSLHNGEGLQEPGELAFAVADAIDEYVGSQYDFARLAAAKGAVIAALDQFDERVVKPYEAVKLAEHGEVFVLSRRGLT